jgi:ATP-dependent Zn protease
MTQPAPFRPEGPNPQGRIVRGMAGWIIFTAIAIITVVFFRQNHSARQISWDDFRDRLQANEISELSIYGDKINGTMKSSAGPGAVFQTHIPNSTPSDSSPIDWVRNHAGAAKITVVTNSTVLTNILIPLLPWLVIFGLIWFFMYRKLRKQQRGQF